MIQKGKGKSMNDKIILEKERNFKDTFYSVFEFLVQEFTVFFKYLILIYGVLFVFTGIIFFVMTNSQVDGYINFSIMSLLAFFNFFIIVSYTVSYLKVYNENENVTFQLLWATFFLIMYKFSLFLLYAVLMLGSLFLILVFSGNLNSEIKYSLIILFLNIFIFIYIKFSLIFPISAFNDDSFKRKLFSEAIKLIKSNTLKTFFVFIMFNAITEIFTGFLDFSISKIFPIEYSGYSNKSDFLMDFRFVVFITTDFSYYVLIPIFMSIYSVFSYFSLSKAHTEETKAISA